MIAPPRSIEDGQSAFGSVNAVQRVGNTVVRPVGAWSSAIHRLLKHLESVGFTYSPIAISLNSSGEVLSYIDGEVAMRPWPPALLAEDGIVAVAQMLLAYHQSVENYVPETGSVWRVPGVRWRDDMVVRHGDLGPWNMVWEADLLVGLIDWEFAEPGYPIEDVAQIAWNCVPLYPPKKSIQAGIAPDQQALRLEILCEIYGIDRTSVINKVAQMQIREFFRLKTIGKTGQEPWLTWLQRGGLQNIADASRWLYEAYSPSVQRPNLQ